MSGIEDFKISDSAKRMGRPPLNLPMTTVRLSKEALAEIDELMGRNQRAEFIRQAVDEKLARERRKPRPAKD
jgi:hypothetical protein